MCYKVDQTYVLPPIYLNGEMIPVVNYDKHLGNYISINIADKHTINNNYNLYQQNNKVISNFRVCDSSTLDSIHRTYCMHMYGSELWDLNCNYVKDFKVAWRKVKRRIWKFLYRAHNVIVHTLSYDIDLQLDTIIIKFVHLGLNHSNNVCKSILLSKLCCLQSPFASNYRYLSSKNNISHDWFTDVSHLIGKVRMKFLQNSRSSNEVRSLIKLCAIRDVLSTYNTLSHSYTYTCHLIEIISLE